MKWPDFSGHYGQYRMILDNALVEMRGLEPLTSALRTPRSPS